MSEQPMFFETKESERKVREALSKLPLPKAGDRVAVKSWEKFIPAIVVEEFQDGTYIVMADWRTFQTRLCFIHAPEVLTERGRGFE